MGGIITSNRKGEKGIILSKHAKEKLAVLKKHGIDLSVEFVISLLKNPDNILDGYGGRLVAEAGYNSNKKIRVVYEKHEDGIVVITVYPAKRGRYDKNKIQ